MMMVRGYEIPEHELQMLEADFAEFTLLAKARGRSIREGISTTYYHPATMRKTYVYYLYGEGSKEVGIENVKQVVTYMTGDTAIDSAILVTENKVSSTAYQELKRMPKYHFQNFRFDELDCNPMEHFLSAKHEIVPKDVLTQINPRDPIQVSKLPLIIVKDLHYTGFRKIDGDPVAKFLGAQEGDIIRVTRRNFFEDTPVKTSIAYRLVKAI